MTRTEQKKFIRDLTGAVAKELCVKIDQGKIPDEWDGIELRQLIADKSANNTHPQLMTGARKREYRNTCIVELL